MGLLRLVPQFQIQYAPTSSTLCIQQMKWYQPLAMHSTEALAAAVHLFVDQLLIHYRIDVRDLPTRLLLVGLGELRQCTLELDPTAVDLGHVLLTLLFIG